MATNRFNLLILSALPCIASAAHEGSLHDELEYLRAEAYVSTASRYQEKISDTPATIFVITKQQIQERGYTNLLQALESLPNIDIQRYASQVTSDQISIRGLAKNNGFIILQDGIRINSPTGEIIPVNDNFPIHYAKQIEVMYGPASVMYGADALAGVINIITEKPEDVDGVEVKGIVGENNTHSTYVNAGKKISENISVIAGGHYKETDNANLARYYPSTFALNDLTTFGGQTITRAADRTGYRGDNTSHSAFAKLTLYKDLDIGLNHSIFKARSDIGTFPDLADYGAKAYLDTELGTAYANYRLHFSEKLTGFVRANYSWYGLLPDSRFVNKFNGFSSTGGYKFASGERKQIESNLQYEINAQHKVSGGVSFEDYYSIPKTYDLERPYDPDKGPMAQNAYYAGTNDTLPVKMQYLGYTNIGIYLQWSANWSEMFSTTVAIRRDSDSRYQETINPRLGLVFKPTDRLVMKMLYGTAFLAPSPFFSREHYGSFTGVTNAQGEYISNFMNIPNPDLRPETIETYEFGMDYQAAPRLNVGLGAYYSTTKDIISPTLTPTPDSHYVPGGFINTTQHNSNIGKAISYGGDVHFDYQYKFSDSAVKLWGSYSYLDGELSRSDLGYATDLPVVSKNKVKLGLTYSYQDKYFITPKLYWIGRTNSSQPEPNNPRQLQTVAGYTRVDLYASAKLIKDVALFVNVSNLFDQRFYNTGDLYGTSFIASPQDPRVVSGGFTYQF